ncbi:hypothetical protein [Sinomonas sp. P47F7]|uniref:primosomal protein N' family DNA-binding protein n=1 Tax=Sinomonas sp. P47F7 TaxID=3410987 RepID=UPI003BF5E77C
MSQNVPVPGGEAGPEAAQPSLLVGLPEPARPSARVEAARERPVARVCVESPLPQLDRLFDYLVPEQLSEAAQPGVRVRVRVAGQEHAGFLLERAESSDSGVALQPLLKVISPAVVLTPTIARLAAAVAERWAGALGDVLRFAVPPRAARVESEYLGELAGKQLPARCRTSAPCRRRQRPTAAITRARRRGRSFGAARLSCATSGPAGAPARRSRRLRATDPVAGRPSSPRPCAPRG